MNGITYQIRIGEDIPLEPGQTNKVFVNTVYLNRKTKDRTPGNNSAMDVEINTKIPVELHSKKLKCGLIVVITVSTLSAILSISLAYYHCVNMSLLQKQVDFLLMKMENISSRQHSDSPSLSSSSAEAQIAGPHSVYGDVPSATIKQHAVTPTSRPIDTQYINTVLSNGLFVAHFNGAYKNPVNLGTDSSIGPWVRDDTVSSPNSYDKIELEKNYVIIKESGLYMFYVQIMYMSQEPCCYTVFASQRGAAPRQLAACAAAGDGGPAGARALLSCAAHGVARLYQGDVVNIAQREHNRTLRLQKGYSYFGFIKLAS